MTEQLQVKHLIKRYPGVTALKGIDMELYSGEVVALLGENGAGKSTLVKILCGVIPYGQYEGEIFLKGEKLRLNGIRQASKKGIAMIPQELNIHPELTIAENIVLGNWPMRGPFVDRARMLAQAEEALAKLDFDIDVTMKAGMLNSSLQQLVCIARALLQNPDILILDEPTSALTKAEAELLLERVKSLRDQGICCIYITHKIDEVFKIADRVIVFRDGSLIRTYAREKMETSAIVEDIVGKKGGDAYQKVSYATDEVVLAFQDFSIRHPYANNKMLLENVSFDLKKGEILGLAGLVGTGRSELLKAAFGALPKVSGVLSLNGAPVEVKKTSDAIRLGIGLLTENRGLDGYVKTMNVGENMTLAILRKLSRRGFLDQRQEKALTKEYFQRLSIKAPSARTPILSLSGGNQQKVLVAKWLLNDCKILFLDEPTRGIDVGAKAEIYSLMAELARQGTSIIMVSSELPEMLKVCDRFIILAGGKKQGEVVQGSERVTETALMEKISVAESASDMVG